MAKLTDFVSQAEIDREIETSGDVLAGKLAKAEQVAAYARSIAPEDSGEYKAGIKVRRHGRTGVGVHWTDPKSNIIEDGTEDTPEFAIRRRTEAHFHGDGRE